MYSATAANPRRDPSAPPTTRTPNVWPVIGTGCTDDVDLGGQEDEQRAGHDERDVADARVDPLADADRDEEIGDREATFRGRRAVESRDGDGHRDSGARVT